MSRGGRRIAVALLLLLVPALMGVARPSGLADVRDVRTWSYPGYTRVVVELSREVGLQAEGLVRLAANTRAGRPARAWPPAGDA